MHDDSDAQFFATLSMIMATTALAVTALLLTPEKATAQQPDPQAAYAAEMAKPTPGVRITDLTLGAEVSPDKRIAVPTTRFGPQDTINLCVTTNVPSSAARDGTLGVLWTYGTGEDSQMVKTSSLSVSFDGEGRTIFTITNTRPWPEGAYTVEVFLDGVSVGTRSFSVGP